MESSRGGRKQADRAKQAPFQRISLKAASPALDQPRAGRKPAVGDLELQPALKDGKPHLASEKPLEDHHVPASVSSAPIA
jgi:hypothetical protein